MYRVSQNFIKSLCNLKYYAWTSHVNERNLYLVCECSSLFLRSVAMLYKYPAGKPDCLVVIFTFCIFVQTELYSIMFNKLISRLINFSALHLKIPSFMGPSVRIHLGMITTSILYAHNEIVSANYRIIQHVTLLSFYIYFAVHSVCHLLIRGHYAGNFISSHKVWYHAHDS